MQFAWLILMPVTLVNIVVTALIFFISDSLHLPTWVFLVVLAVVNWAAVFVFIQIVTRATLSSTRRAQAPAIRAQRRATTTPALQLRDGIPARVPELPEPVGVATDK
jgi:NADH-quinone oxidoreductase subunit H